MRLKKISEYTYQADDCKENTAVKIGMYITGAKIKEKRSLPQLHMMWAVAEKVALQKCDRITPENKKAITYDIVKRCMISNGHCISYEVGGKIKKVAYSLRMTNKDLTSELATEIVNALYVLWANWIGCRVEELINSVGDID